MSFMYDSRVIGPKGYQELMVVILNKEKNPIDSCCYSPQVHDLMSAKKGAHDFGIKGWKLEPDDQYQGFANKIIK
jgi:hypothetical protein